MIPRSTIWPDTTDTTVAEKSAIDTDEAASPTEPA